MDNILISCAGGPAAVGAIKSLKQIDFKGNIVTIDCDPLAVGRYLSNINYKGNFILQTARSNEGNHIEVLCEYRNMVVKFLKNNYKKSGFTIK